jgi:hypothetical protein
LDVPISTTRLARKRGRADDRIRLDRIERDESVGHETMRIGVQAVPIELAGLRAFAEIRVDRRPLRIALRVQATNQISDAWLSSPG